eukprot:1159279-Pelagomonas_calceolata.AAC.1
MLVGMLGMIWTGDISTSLSCNSLAVACGSHSLALASSLASALGVERQKRAPPVGALDSEGQVPWACALRFSFPV